MTLMAIWCFIVCFGTDEPSVPLSGDFCAAYRPLLVGPSDSVVIKTLPRSLRERIALNELTHRCVCEKLVDTRCERKGGSNGS